MMSIAPEIKRSIHSTIGHLSKQGYCFPPDEKTETIYEAMKTDHAITEFTVIENNTAVGFMTRTTLNETLGGRYGFTLHAQKPISEIMNTDFLKVDCNTSLDKVSELAMQRPFERLYNPIVIEQDGKYSGIVTVKDLLDTSTKVAIAERDEVTVMKDNIKIGLFFMDRKFIIQDHYSRHLEEIMAEKNLCGKCFPDFLAASVGAKDLESIRDYFDMIFDHTFDQDILDDINPFKELHYMNVTTGIQKVFYGEFTTVARPEGEFILVTIYDITAEVELAQQLKEEENRRQEEMKSIFELIQVEPGVFNDFLEDADYEFKRIQETFDNKNMSSHQILVEVYQSVHAVKSNAVILGLNTFGDKAHALESKIKNLREQEGAIPAKDMLKLSVDIAKLYEKERFKAATEKIQAFANAGGEAVRKQSGEVLIESLTKTVNKASGDMGKKVKFVVDGIDDTAIEKGPRRTIKEILMQLIRNSVVHGIEAPADRTAKGKSETGVIRLAIKLVDGNIHVKLGDDGRGLDYNKIAEKALRLNLIKKEDSENRNALLRAIFSPGFSTAETESVHAGRGIGLNLVQDRLRAEKGSIKVQTEPNKGTVFNILFPAA